MNKFYPTLGLLLAVFLTPFVATAQDCNCVIEQINNRAVYSPACDRPREICSLQLIGTINQISLLQFTDLRGITIAFNGNSEPKFLGSALSDATTVFTYTSESSVNLRVIDEDRTTVLANYFNSNNNNNNSIRSYNSKLAACTDNCTLWKPDMATTPGPEPVNDCNCVISNVNNEKVYSRGCDYPTEICSLELGYGLNDIDLTRFRNLRDIQVVIYGNVNPTFEGSTLSTAATQFDVRAGGVNIKVVYPGGERSYALDDNPNNQNTVQYYNAQLAGCGGTCSLLAPRTINDNYVVMPITLTEWTTVARAGYVQLQWHTAAERDNAYFQVSRSTDGTSFQEIGRVAGAGTTDSGTDYTYRDLHPEAGISYYRLEQFDFDGTYTDLGIQAARTGGAMATAFSVSPNPVLAGALLGVHLSTQVMNQQAQLIGPDGRQLGEYVMKNGKIQLPELTAGVYTLRIEGNTSRFVVVP